MAARNVFLVLSLSNALFQFAAQAVPFSGVVVVIVSGELAALLGASP